MYAFENAASRIKSLQGPHWMNWVYTAMGGLIMSLLMLARQRLLWWPFHPPRFPHQCGIWNHVLQRLSGLGHQKASY